MSARFDYLSTGHNQNGPDVFGARYMCQMITPSQIYVMTSVKLICGSAGSPGTVTLLLVTTDGNNDPENLGSPLAIGTIPDGSVFDGSTLREITFVAGYEVAIGTTYALVVQCLGGDNSNDIECRMISTGGYGGANDFVKFTGDGGVDSWSTEYADADIMFECWGDLLASPAGGGGPAALLVAQGQI